MSTQLSASLDLANKLALSSIGRLPQPVRNIARASLTRKALAAFAAVSLLHAASGYLSKWTANNWQRAHPLKAERELALVTGGANGIGQQIAQDLAQIGIPVVIIDIVEPSFKLPSNFFFYKVDITSTTSLREAGTRIRANHGNPTILVNNAGVAFSGTVLEEPEENIRTTFEVNALAHFWTVKEFLPAMIENNHGHIITVASMASFAALGEMADYAATKAAVMAFHESLTQELRHWHNASKVRTSVVHPLWVRTNMTEELIKSNFNQPVMSTKVVSRAVVNQILAQNSGQIILPPYLSFSRMLRAFPGWVQDIARSRASLPLKKIRDVHT